MSNENGKASREKQGRDAVEEIAKMAMLQAALERNVAKLKEEIDELKRERDVQSTRTQKVCRNCDYTWIPRVDTEPLRCPDCGVRHPTDYTRNKKEEN
jgi:rubrerythrin